MGARLRVVLSAAMVLLVLGLGSVGAVFGARANHTAQAVHTQDRQQLQGVLGTLTTEYLLLALEDEAKAVSSVTWTLRPGASNDAAALRALLGRSPLLTYGAEVIGPDGEALSTVAPNGPLPSPSDPGMHPLSAAIAAGAPALSSTMRAGGHPVVGMGVPVVTGGARKATVVGFFRADTSALEAYAGTLHFGRTGHNYVVDSTGAIVAGDKTAVLGSDLGSSPALAAVLHGHAGFAQFHASGHSAVASYSPVGVGGWGTLTIEDAAEFFGPMRSGHLRVETALLALLALATALIVVLAFKREQADHRYHTEIAYRAAHDPLTGLSNRVVMSDALNRAVAAARRDQHDIALLYVDLDGFKQINDSHGHDVGDALLEQVADRLQGCVRTGDLVARMGGDEFTILMVSAGEPHQASVVAERIVEAISRPYTVLGEPITITASVGIAYSHRGNDSAEGLLRGADLAMYQAKDAGRGRYGMSADTAEPAKQ